MKKIIVDLREAADRETLHDITARAFDFPEWYGRNLDALYDLLTEITEDTAVAVFLPEEEAREVSLAESDYETCLEKYLRLLCEAERDNPHLAILLPPREPCI